MSAKIWYLYHSGFAVKTDGHFLVFDYWRDTPKGAGLESGVINPDELLDEDVIVFASHRHGDHYNPEILSWQGKIPKLRLILSDDIPAVDGAVMMGKRQILPRDDFMLETFTSTDEGVAFLIETDGLRIYHAGDLNWWHWEEETGKYNAEMAANYKSQIDLLADKPVDIAFVPVDPRLEAQYHWGIDYLMRAVDVRYAVPMHYGDDAATVRRLLADSAAAGYRERILPLTKRGQSAVID
ncbi:hydrolase [Clostridia bacterium]|nr:hydrolase [Clostridia bacterium]